MKPKIDYTLYLVTDRNIMTAERIEDAVEAAINGGCTAVQLREKTTSTLDFFQIAKRIKLITDKKNVPLIINDRADIGLAVNAAGVHIGQSDLPIAVMRNIVGPDKIIGVSASNHEEAVAAEKSGADYLGIGAMFATSTKVEANLTAMAELHRIRQAVSIPIVAIGGINMETIPSFKGTKIDGIAVVSAILARSDVEASARTLRAAFELIR